MLSQYGTMSLKEVLAPAMELAAGYPIDAQTANSMEKDKENIKQWPYSKAVFLPHLGEKREAPEAGEIFVQRDLLETLKKMVAAEQDALKKGKSRKDAIMAAYDRFYKGDIAKEIVRSSQEQGGLFTMQDLAKWKPVEEEPLKVNYKGIDVYKLQQWTQGPMLLQALNVLENFDLKTMGYNSVKYIHTLYQTMNLTFADRDFYYGDPRFSNNQPMKGLLSKDYAKQRAGLIGFQKNDPSVGPGNPYPFEGKANPYVDLLKQRGFTMDSSKRNFAPAHDVREGTGILFNATNNENDIAINDLQKQKVLVNVEAKEDPEYMDRLWRGTTSVEAADKEGWVVSITPSGGWLPACIAGNTGVGMSQRMQSFVLDSTINPFNVVAPTSQQCLSPCLTLP